MGFRRSLERQGRISVSRPSEDFQGCWNSQRSFSGIYRQPRSRRAHSEDRRQLPLGWPGRREVLILPKNFRNSKAPAASGAFSFAKSSKKEGAFVFLT